jgi:hypothetical protein
MSNIGLSTWLLMGMVVTGVYVLPSVTARFSGSHTMEFNASGTGQTNATEINCGNCHGYISDELNSTGMAGTNRVLQQHIIALQTGEYANATDGTPFLEIPVGVGIDKNEVCPLCHATETNIVGSHTQVVTRLCDDLDCHGLTSNRPTEIFGGQNVTEKLNSTADVHWGWYSAMAGVDSNRSKANTTDTSGEHGGNYGSGYLTCLGCHTTIGVNMNVSRPQAYNINITIDSDGTVALPNSQVTTNQTNKSQEVSRKIEGTSIWS